MAKEIKNEHAIPTQKPEEQCFVIMPISNQVGYEDGHFQLVYEDIIKPSIIAAGLRPCRADETKNTNLIQLDILRRVVESTIAVCDMSAKNPNIFYELGMRQAFDMPTVLVRDDATEAPFDVNGIRYVTYKKDMKHRSVKKAVEELTETIKDTYAKRDDKYEINSLIRLMELAKPAKINQVELSEEARIEKLNEFHLKEIMDSIQTLSENQNIILREISKSNIREPITDDIINSYFKNRLSNNEFEKRKDIIVKYIKANGKEAE